MKEFKFKYNFLRIAPRKTRLVVNLVKNMTLDEAINQTKFLTKSASKPVNELLRSARSSVKEIGTDLNNFYIKSFICNEGPAFKRRRFKSKGRAVTIKKRTSHLVLTLAQKELKKQVKSKKNKIKNK